MHFSLLGSSHVSALGSTATLILLFFSVFEGLSVDLRAVQRVVMGSSLSKATSKLTSCENLAVTTAAGLRKYLAEETLLHALQG